MDFVFQFLEATSAIFAGCRMFQDVSYERHARGFSNDLVDPERKRIAETWLNSDTADAWRHARGYEIANYLGGDTEWMTVGDGRFGLDAIRLKERGVRNVLATDIDESLLRSAKENGLISEYRVENAEKLTAMSGSFDYVFCKEAYHHFPRPAIALYEMLRVARKGVILVEPNDRNRSILRRCIALLKTAFGHKQITDMSVYEEDGNYAYSISQREMEKVCLGVNLPQVAFKWLNDFYTPDLAFQPADKKSPAYRKMRRTIAVRDFLCRIGLDQPMILMACLFHEAVTEEQKRRMLQNGWSVIDLSRNPYIGRD